MAIAALIVSIASAFTALASALYVRQQVQVARHANSLPVIVDLFGQHRQERLTLAREIIGKNRLNGDPSFGFDQLPPEILELAWFYDNLGVLVAHDVVALEPIAGYLGGNVITAWDRLEPYIETERTRRAGSSDPRRWQEYFENLAALLRTKMKPDDARKAGPLWTLEGNGSRKRLGNGRTPWRSVRSKKAPEESHARSRQS